MWRALIVVTAGCGFEARLPSATPDAPPPAIVPTYHVDFDAGDDANDGLSITTAWKHAPGDAAATATPASIVLVPGDVVSFKGGVVYRGEIRIPASGEAGKPITYLGLGDWGTGRAVIDGEQQRRFGVAVTQRAHVRIDGFVLERFDKTMNPIGVSIDASEHVEVTRNEIRDVYHPTNPGGPQDWAGAFGTGVLVRDSSNVTVRENAIRDVGYAGIAYIVSTGVMRDGLIAKNAITNMNVGIRVETLAAPAGTKIDGLAILDNYIHDYDQYLPAANWHRDGIDIVALAAPLQVTIENVEIARNYFEDTGSANSGSNAWLYITGACKTFRIHHNVLHSAISYFAVRINSRPHVIAANHLIASNVIANVNGIGLGIHIDHATGVQLLNNIFANDHDAYQVATESMPGFVADFNVIHTVDPNATILVRLDAGPADNPAGDHQNTLAELRGNGFEANGFYADPMFTTAQAQIDSDPKGFAPAVGSPAVDSGTTAGFTTDFAGTMIHTGAGPDIGAFEAH